MKIKPIGPRILIKDVKPEEKTKSGIILPSISKEKSTIATVIEVGESTEDCKITVNVGDTIVYVQYSGTPIKNEDEELKIIHMQDILAIIES